MPKVLIVSAADLAPELGRTILWGDDVERVASTPGAALEVARAFVPSLVVVGGFDAGAACQLIKKLRENPGTRRSSIVVALGDPPYPEEQEELQRSGANLVLDGRVDPVQWDVRLEKLLSVPRRMRVRFPVRVARHVADGGAEPSPAVAIDLSTRGILLETEARFETGAPVELRFTLPGAPGEVTAIGSVVRANTGRPGQVGVQFLTLMDEAQQQIRSLLEAAVPEASFGRYEVLGLLGEGSMGRVYRAFDPLAKRVLAIKTLRPEHRVGPEAEDYLRRFRREAQAAARLDHSSIVTIFDVGDDYFAMEFLEGNTLQAILHQRDRLGPAEVVAILRPIADALDFAHSMGTIHRDVKPSNIMVLADGRPKLMDLGVAHVASSVITVSGQSFGSPAYMAPEQITRSAVTPLTDVFSLAVVAYEALTGQKPFQGESVTPILYNVVNADPAPPSSWNPALPSSYDDVFRRALAKDPCARFPTAAALVAALDRGTTGGEAPTPVPAAPDPVRRKDDSVDTLDLKQVPWAGDWLRRQSWLHLHLGAWLAALALLVALAAALLVLRWAPPQVKVLPPPPGLEITTEPAGATVLLDGSAVGTAPLLLANLPPGAHALRVMREGFVPAELMLEAPVEGPPILLRFSLQPLTATLRLDSEPSPAFVRVDGQPAGTTPVSALRLQPGKREILVEGPGYRPWTRTIDAKAGARYEALASLEPAAGTPSAREVLRLKGWVRRGDLVTLGPGVTPPRRISGGAVPYPEAAHKLRLKGTVTVELTVTEEGGVLDPHVVESAGEILDRAVLEAARGWRYEPAESAGVGVSVRIRESQSFGPDGD